MEPDISGQPLIERDGQADWRCGSEEVEAVGMVNVGVFEADVMEGGGKLGVGRNVNQFISGIGLPRPPESRQRVCEGRLEAPLGSQGNDS